MVMTNWCRKRIQLPASSQIAFIQADMCRICGWHFHMYPHLTLPSAQRAGWCYQPHLTQKVTQRSDLGHGHEPTQGPDSKPLILSSMPPPSTPGEKISEENSTPKLHQWFPSKLHFLQFPVQPLENDFGVTFYVRKLCAREISADNLQCSGDATWWF